ncbi:T6SS effector amidase Tae4 family protein [Photobacterium alginatilyticum]|uniref:T6SS effector amidase Tae4 family protein n=1 Tax=Photobacterium alginatilyticum TaxID=1775171 RepID=UPI004068BDFB
MAVIQFANLWKNHPYPQNPCDKAHFPNQCAIRMGVALEKSGIDTSSFDLKYPRRRCYPGFKHSPKHILAAQELANWIAANPNIFGQKKVITTERESSLKGIRGIIFIKNGWGSTDHIDVWNGETMKGGSGK